MDYISHLEVLWDYMQLHQKPQKADVILGFGNFNTNIARRASELYLAGYACKILFTGGLGRNTLGLLPEPEARRFSRIALDMGVPEKDILLEEKSRNTAENILFSKELLEAKSIPHRCILGVHQPFMERRICAAMGIYWPELSFSVTSPQITLSKYLADSIAQGITENAAISVIVGDFQRIELYAKKGWQTPQQIPPHAWDAYHALVGLGFDQQLAK